MTYWTPRLDFWVSYTSYIFIRNPEINSSFFPIYLINILYTRFLVLTHRYGRDGRDSKKFEDKSLVFDFCFLQRIAEKTFIQDYKLALNSFVVLLNEKPKTGNPPPFLPRPFC
jgi:hypothetical protein